MVYVSVTKRPPAKLVHEKLNTPMTREEIYLKNVDSVVAAEDAEQAREIIARLVVQSRYGRPKRMMNSEQKRQARLGRLLISLYTITKRLDDSELTELFVKMRGTI